jgi:hypothetical protein
LLIHIGVGNVQPHQAWVDWAHTHALPDSTAPGFCLVLLASSPLVLDGPDTENARRQRWAIPFTCRPMHFANVAPHSASPRLSLFLISARPVLPFPLFLCSVKLSACDCCSTHSRSCKPRKLFVVPIQSDSLAIIMRSAAFTLFAAGAAAQFTLPPLANFAAVNADSCDTVAPVITSCYSKFGGSNGMLTADPNAIIGCACCTAGSNLAPAYSGCSSELRPSSSSAAGGMFLVVFLRHCPEL